jgi:TolB protein
MYGNSYTDIVETEVANFRTRRLAQFPGLNVGAAAAPNGKVLALILSRDNQVELYVKNIGNAGMKRLTTGKAVESSPCWSPDGGRICFVSDMGGRPNLYLIGATGGGMTRVPTQGSESASPSWSADNQIAYSAKMGGSYVIAVLDLKGKDPHRIVTTGGGDWSNPSWAPDNRHLVCTRSGGRRSELFVLDTWTGKTRQLLGSKYNCFTPNWSNLR